MPFKKGHKPESGMTGRHHSEEAKRKMSESNKGNKHPRWKGGKYKDRGYIWIHKPNHPFCNKHNYIKRSRFIMEKHLGRYLLPKEVIHHINEIKDDDKIENLMLFATIGKHTTFHNKLKPRNIKGKFI